MTDRAPIPLTVTGGFLGAGKTTLLNRLLRDSDRRIGVLVNDFGAIAIDAELVRSREGETVSLTNGCVCCGLSGELLFALAGFRDRPDPPEHVVVEASGVGDPAAIARYGEVPGFRRDAAIVVADAATVMTQARDPRIGSQVSGQLRAADLVVLSKSDLVDQGSLAETRAWLARTAPSAGVVEASHGRVAPDVLLGARDAAPREARSQGGPPAPAHPNYATWSWAGQAPLDGAGLSQAIRALPDGVLRVKGILRLREDPEHRYVLQLVGRRGAIARDRPWGADAPGSRLVMIGLSGAVRRRELDAMMRRLTSRPG